MATDPWTEAGKDLANLPPKPNKSLQKPKTINRRGRKKGLESLIKNGELRLEKGRKKEVEAWLQKKFKPLYKDIKSGKITSKAARSKLNLPKIYIGEDLQDVSNVTANARGENKPLLAKSGAEANLKREQSLRDQTVKSGAADQTGYGAGVRGLRKGMQDHHIIFRTLVEPFFKDLTPAQIKEMSEHFLREGTPLGNVLVNLQGLDEDLHKELHDWAREVRIQVTAGPDNYKNMQFDSKGNLKRIAGVGPKALPTGSGGTRFPDLSKLKFNERIKAASEWMELFTEPIIDKTSEITHKQELRIEAEGGKKARSIDEIRNKWYEEVDLYKSRQELIDRGKIVDGKEVPLDAEDLSTDLNAKPKRKGLLKKVGAGVLSIGGLTPGVAAAEELKAGNYTEAGKTYLKEQLLGEGVAAGLKGSAVAGKKVAGTKLAQTVGKKLLTMGGKKLATSLGGKAVASIAGGPTAPIIMGGLLAKDLYDVTNVLTDGALEPKQIRGRSGAKREKEKEHVIKQRQLMLEMLAQERKNKEFETGGR